MSEGLLKTLWRGEFLREAACPKGFWKPFGEESFWKLLVRRVSGRPSERRVFERSCLSAGLLETLRRGEFLREAACPKGFWKPFGEESFWKLLVRRVSENPSERRVFERSCLPEGFLETLRRGEFLEAACPKGFWKAFGEERI